MIGDVFPSEKQSFTDSRTGAQIMQYTSVGQTNRTLYFTNRPWVCDGEHVVFLSDRTGRNEMFMLHLKSGKITQVTDTPGQANVSNCLHPQRPELYFRTDSTIRRVHLDTLKTEELLRAPAGYRIGILDLKGAPWLVFEMMEMQTDGVTLLKGKTAPVASSPPTFAETAFRRPRTLVCRYHVDDDIFEVLWGDARMITHVQSSPTNPDVVIYSDCAAYGADRCLWLDASRKVKRLPQPTFPESNHARASHEFFTRRGNLACQWMEGDLERDGEHTIYHAFLNIADLRPGEINAHLPERFRKYEVPEKSKDLAHHFTMSLDENWGVHDRWIAAPTWEENMSWLSIFRHQQEHPQTIVRPICFHDGHKHDQRNLGAELSIRDDDESALYTSFLGGSANLCEVDLRPFVDDILEATS